MNYTTKEVIEFKTPEEIDKYYGKFESYCSEFKKIRGDKFSYDLDIDYEKMELSVTINFVDDNSKGDTQSN